MKRIIKTLLLISICFAGLMCLTACNPVLSLNPKYSYTSFELNLGENISTDITEYVDFGELDVDERRFVRENTELLYDGKPMSGNEFSEVGDHTLTINYCGHQYRKYDILITDKEPPVFTKAKDFYTFVGLKLNDSVYDEMFEAEDNCGNCELRIDKSEADYNKAGTYVMKATATDPSGNKSTAEASIIVQEPKYGAMGTYVFVSIEDQTLTYFVDGEIALQTPVVTGNSWVGHNTPRGTFRINNMTRNQTLRGREDNGDEYESFVYYWMAFIGGSYGLHDATWRSNFGGTIYQGGGSHGCVNMPLDKAGELFGMVSVGTPVLVY